MVSNFQQTGGRDGTGPHRRKTAFVLSGGGGHGSYELGVMKALFEGAVPPGVPQPVTPDIYTGTSVGSYNATFMVSHGDKAPDAAVLAELQRVWRERFAETPETCGNGVFRVRGAPFQLFDPGCLLHPLENTLNLAGDAAYFARYLASEAVEVATGQGKLTERLLNTIDIGAFFSVAPLESAIKETIDLEALRQATKKLVIVASDFKAGVAVLFSKQDITDVIGPKTILASAAIPAIFPPVIIDNVPFVDGGVTMNTPIGPAIDKGAEIIHVIFIDPPLSNIPLSSSTLDVAYRMYVMLIAKRFNDTFVASRSLKERLRRIFQQDLRAGDLEEELEDLVEFNPVAKFLKESRGPGWYRHVPEIHIHRPQTDLGGILGLLDFDLDRVNENIALGYQETVAHDCQAAGCVFPEAVVP